MLPYFKLLVFSKGAGRGNEGGRNKGNTSLIQMHYLAKNSLKHSRFRFSTIVWDNWPNWNEIKILFGFFKEELKPEEPKEEPKEVSTSNYLHIRFSFFVVRCIVLVE